MKINAIFVNAPSTPESLADMIRLIEEGAISGKMAKEIVDDMYKTGKSPQTIIKEKGLVQITDEGELVKTITSIIEANPGQLADYRGGKEKLFGFFVGQVMKATQGKANPQLRQRNSQKDACRMTIKTIFWKNNTAVLIDQNALPLVERYIVCKSYQEIISTIKDLTVRGAPAIGVAAAMGAALGALHLPSLSSRGIPEEIFRHLR